jgi:hypothetical protein
MRGNPLIRVFLVLLGIVGMGIPVWCLTQTSAVSAQESAPVLGARQGLLIDLYFAHPPEMFVVSSLGQPIGSGTKGAQSVHLDWNTDLPKEGQDLLLKVKWPDGTPRTAVEVKVANSEGRVLVDKTLWGERPITEIITVLPEHAAGTNE